MYKSLKGKWVLVTAGSDRVGKFICEAFAKRGANVVIHARTDRPSLHTLKKELKKRYGVRAKVETGELTKRKKITALFKRCPQLAVVVSNAAVFKSNDRKTNMSANKEAQLLVLQAGIAHARAHKKDITIFLTGDGHLGRGNAYGKHLQGYSESKKWVHEDIQKFAKYGDEGIRVIGILPGPILPPPTASAKATAEVAKQIHMRKQLKKPWIGKWYGTAVATLAEVGPGVTGSCIFVDAGRDFKGKVPKEH